MSQHRRVAIAVAGFVSALAVIVSVKAWANGGPSFIDPTATLVNSGNIHLGHFVYVAPFAALRAGSNAASDITIGDDSNVQDNVTVATRGKLPGKVEIGDHVILAHGCSVKAPAKIGVTGTCPAVPPAAICASFVSFNAEVDGATIEKDAIVSALARVGPGVTIPSGRKVLPGKNVTSNAEVMAKTAPVTEADREFMKGVIEVNVCFAEGYDVLHTADPTNVTGINYDPDCFFNPGNQLPTLHGVMTRDPLFRNRIIGDVRLEDTKSALDAVMGQRCSLRADEGEPFEVGHIGSMGERVTFHALEHTELMLGNNGRYGNRCVVHGGPADFNPTTTGDNVRIGDEAVFFRSHIGNNSTVGAKSVVQQCDFPNNTVIPDHQIWISNAFFGPVEW